MRNDDLSFQKPNRVKKPQAFTFWSLNQTIWLFFLQIKTDQSCIIKAGIYFDSWQLTQ